MVIIVDPNEINFSLKYGIYFIQITTIQVNSYKKKKNCIKKISYIPNIILLQNKKILE